MPGLINVPPALIARVGAGVIVGDRIAITAEIYKHHGIPGIALFVAVSPDQFIFFAQASPVNFSGWAKFAGNIVLCPAAFVKPLEMTVGKERLDFVDIAILVYIGTVGILSLGLLAPDQSLAAIRQGAAVSRGTHLVFNLGNRAVGRDVPVGSAGRECQQGAGQQRQFKSLMLCQSKHFYFLLGAKDKLGIIYRNKI